MSMSSVLDYHQAVAPRNVQYPVHVGGMSSEVHRNYCACPRRNRCLHAVGVDIQSVALNVCEDRQSACLKDGAGCGHKRIWRDDHFVTRANSLAPQRNLQRYGSVGYCDAMLTADITAEAHLKLSDRLAISAPDSAAQYIEQPAFFFEKGGLREPISLKGWRSTTNC